MTKQIPAYLKLVTDTSPEAQALASEDLAAFAELARAFEQVVGWRLQVDSGSAPSGTANLMWSAPVNPGVGAAPGHIRLVSAGDAVGAAGPRFPLDEASVLADGVGKLWAELLATRHALWQREAELAVGVPLVVRDDENAPPLSERLEAVLRAGAEAVGCQAAVLYLLDPATTELKIRSSWGLPRRRLTDPARPLRGALADLEALLGHAVVLADSQLHDYWKVPESGFASCVCVPVATANIPLGTLWTFCREPRDFNDAQTNILEVVAGRLAGDLERQVLADEAVLARQQAKQLTAAQGWQQAQLPNIAPVIDGWDVAATAFHADPVGGTFYDWFALEDGGLAVAAGDTLARGIPGALTTASLRAAVRALGSQGVAVEQLLDNVNSILWTGSDGNGCAGLFHAALDPRGAWCEFGSAGPLRVLAIKGDDATLLAGPTTPLGWQEQLRGDAKRHKMSAGELIVVYGASCLADCDELTLVTLDAQLALRLGENPNQSADELSAAADGILRDCPGADQADRVAVVIKRRAR